MDNSALMAAFDALYTLSADDGRGQPLFGASVSLARQAFKRSLAGDAMPVVWFEVPLSGTPRFDLHVAYDNGVLHREAPFKACAADGHGALLNWYASQPREGGGLALAYDVGDGRIADPAVHANVMDAGTFDIQGFFDHVNRSDAAALYDGFIRRLPRGWDVWYFGVHPGRPGAPVRVDCFVKAELKRAYAEEQGRLLEDLRRAGIADIGARALRIGSAIAQSPFSLELQFDVLADGKPGPTVGLSANFPMAPASKVRPQWERGGEVMRLMEFAEELGVADDRWRHTGQVVYTTAFQDGDGVLALYCVPVFVKFRVREGEPLDAKIYLQASCSRDLA